MNTKLVRSNLYGGLFIGAVVAGGWALPVRGQETAPAQKLSGPTRLEAGGSPIDTELGAAAPCLGDFDGDGRVDLLVGQADGKLRVFLNRGGNEQPRFDDFQWFKAGAAGDAGQVTPSPDRGMIGGAVGFVPQWVDLDGDGRDDILSCTGNGAIIVFRRQPDGKFAEGESLKRDDGLEILGTPGCAVHAGDWDGDGDLDLCLAVQRGGLSLLRNTAGRQKPIFGEPEAFQVDDDDPV